MLGLVVLLAGVLSIVVGGMSTHGAVKRKFGQVTAQTTLAANARGVTPKSAPILVMGGLVLVLVGIGILVFG